MTSSNYPNLKFFWMVVIRRKRISSCSVGRRIIYIELVDFETAEKKLDISPHRITIRKTSIQVLELATQHVANSLICKILTARLTSRSLPAFSTSVMEKISPRITLEDIPALATLQCVRPESELTNANVNYSKVWQKAILKSDLYSQFDKRKLWL